MKSVCIDARLLRICGIGTYLENLLGVLRKAPLRWFVLVHKEQLSYMPWKNGLEPIVIKAPIYSAREQLELPLKIPKVDLFWSPHYNIPLFPIRAKKRLVTIHDVLHLTFSHLFKPFAKAYAKVVLEAAVRLSDQIITDSYFSKREIEAHTSANPHKLEVIYLGVDHIAFNPLAKQDASRVKIFEKYQLQAPFLLFVGSYKKHKNVEGLVETFNLLHQRGWHDLSLVIVGMPLIEKIYQDFPSLQGSMRFIGNVPDLDLPHFYSSAEAFVFPSLYEGFGLPPLEAMSCGCPTVVSAQGAMPEVCGDGAVYVDPLDPSHMADILEKLLQNAEMRRELVQKGIERSRTFSWERCAEKHYEIIERLIRP